MLPGRDREGVEGVPAASHAREEVDNEGGQLAGHGGAREGRRERMLGMRGGGQGGRVRGSRDTSRGARGDRRQAVRVRDGGGRMAKT
eukprot:14413503-Heterocapsa_arctica.AAC.1